jgi:hypothetical protein
MRQFRSQVLTGHRHLSDALRSQIFVISSKKIQQRGYETLFAFTTANERSVFARIVLAAPKKYQVRRLQLWLSTPAVRQHLNEIVCTSATL